MKQRKIKNILFTSGHPAQVHNFRLVREELIKQGYNVFWLTTNKDIATQLLDVYHIPYALLQRPSKGFFSKVKTLLFNVCFCLRFLRANHIDLCITRTCPYTSTAAWLLRIPHIILDDTEHAAVSIFQRPFTKMVQTVAVADSFDYVISPKQLRFPGNIELFYLHPQRFSYSPEHVYQLLGLPLNKPFALVRFVKWDAYHDVKLVGGFTLEQKRQLIHRLQEHMHVFISSETELPEDLEPFRIHIPIERMHEVQACASLFVGESATMASESVVLGTPAIYIDQVGRGYTDEEAREDLLWMFRPVQNRTHLSANEPSFILGGVEECLATASLLSSPDFDKAAYAARHRAWLDKKFDCTAWFTWLIANYPESSSAWRANRPVLEKQFK